MTDPMEQRLYPIDKYRRTFDSCEPDGYFGRSVEAERPAAKKTATKASDKVGRQSGKRKAG
jgi:hypothetical protein